MSTNVDAAGMSANDYTAAPDGVEIEQGRWDEAEEWGTYCPDCMTIIGPGEEGHGNDECFECGGVDVYEVPW